MNEYMYKSDLIKTLTDLVTENKLQEIEIDKNLQENKELIANSKVVTKEELKVIDSQLADINKTKTTAMIDDTAIKKDDNIDVEYLKLLQVQNYAEYQRKLRNNEGLNILCKGTSITYGYDIYSSDKRPPSAELTDLGRTHVRTRASISYPEQLQKNLRTIYGNAINVENLGYSGSYAKFHYEQYYKKRNNDLTLIEMGTNDAKLPECPYSGDVKTFIYWYEQLIIRELIWGKAVIIILPSKTRETNDTIIDIFSNSIILLCKKYNIPYVDLKKILVNYNADIYSDNLHFNGNGYSIIANGITASIVNAGIDNKTTIQNGNNLGIFETTDSVKYIGAELQQHATGYTPYSVNPSTRSVLRFLNNSKALYSFYTEDENLILYPTTRIEPNSELKITLDFGFQQAEVENITNIYGTTSTNNKFGSTYIEITSSDYMLKYKDLYERDGVKPLVIANKGWHTLLIETVGEVKLWGLEFKKIFNTKYKKLWSGEVFNVNDKINLSESMSNYDKLQILVNSNGYESTIIDFNTSLVQDIRGVNISNDVSSTAIVFSELGVIKESSTTLKITRNKQVSLIDGVQSIYDKPNENKIVEIIGVRYRD